MCDQQIQYPVSYKTNQKQMKQRKYKRYCKQPPGMYSPFQQTVASKYCHIIHEQIFKQEHIGIKYIYLASPLFSRFFCIFIAIIKQYRFAFCQNKSSKSLKSSLIFDKRSHIPCIIFSKDAKRDLCVFAYA